MRPPSRRGSRLDHDCSLRTYKAGGRRVHEPFLRAPHRPGGRRHRRGCRDRSWYRPGPGRLRGHGGHLGAGPGHTASAAEEVEGLGIVTDVRQSDQVDAALARTTAELGPVNILVNNAGGVFWSSLLETSENGWDALYRANLKHVILCTQRVARTMVETGTGGSIISVTSIEGVRAAPGYAAYAAAKAGVINFTKTAALELAPHGIRVNALAPDITLTEGMMSVAPAGSRGTTSA